MVFFNVQWDSTGQEQWQVSHRWWYYWAVTVPLTVAVFLVWLVWRGFRIRRHATNDIDVDDKVTGSASHAPLFTTAKFLTPRTKHRVKAVADNTETGFIF